MNIFHFPPSIKELNQIVDISYSVRQMGKLSRQNQLFFNVRKSTTELGVKCHQCELESKDLHHIKPVWACAVDAVMMNRQVSDSLFDKWNNDSNLIPLCSPCHNRQQSIDDLIWKIALADKHRLAYTITWGDERIRDQVRENHRCPIDLPGYVDWYLSQQKIKLTKKLIVLKNQVVTS